MSPKILRRVVGGELSQRAPLKVPKRTCIALTGFASKVRTFGDLNPPCANLSLS